MAIEQTPQILTDITAMYACNNICHNPYHSMQVPLTLKKEKEKRMHYVGGHSDHDLPQ